ncbi:PREDICTED: (R,S)-reticuline 7-O-methyltransferase-like [Fragaria vesca subsp. vesca]|uniref:(R,S)-reticuline 7-O-methyltransferase-like n=1 Tax=Fragaria vesca subsp. vesca TaxID=101020 RepID=UPI0002C332A6|nr:PREDICTED: (R,S)-reticuline 7-O-methyltransferase-like [Fragaria vesca subsp. vesca]
MEAVNELDEATLRGQADVWKYMLGFADSMALKSAVELRIPDIINSHCQALSLSDIVSNIDSKSPSPDITCLSRIMRLLVRRNIFAAHHDDGDSGETLYGLTPSSRWLLQDSELTLAPMVLLQTDPILMAPMQYFSQCVKQGGTHAFSKAHGRDIWQFFSENLEANQLFNDAMACSANIIMKVILARCKGAFDDVTTLVDVGGGTGRAAAEIVKAYPSIKAINFDLPYVVATAPAYHGVSHVGGDMFDEGNIPNADAIFMKWIMHDWSDGDCIKILKNCRKAIPERSGKVIIVDAVLEPNGDGLFDDTGLVFDLLMITHSSGGKERSESEWKQMLEQAGFPRYNIINIPAVVSIIEAYPV